MTNPQYPSHRALFVALATIVSAFSHGVWSAIAKRNTRPQAFTEHIRTKRITCLGVFENLAVDKHTGPWSSEESQRILDPHCLSYRESPCWNFTRLPNHMIINITEIASISLCHLCWKRKGTACTVCTLRRFGAPGEFQIIEFFFFFFKPKLCLHHRQAFELFEPLKHNRALCPSRHRR